MLLTSWIRALRKSFARRRFAHTRRKPAEFRQQITRHSRVAEVLEERSLLSIRPLVIDINSVTGNNQFTSTVSSPGFTVTNNLLDPNNDGVSDYDDLVIGVSQSSVTGSAMFESTVFSGTGVGIRINLSNLTGLNHITIDNVVVTSGANQAGIEITLDNVALQSLVVDQTNVTTTSAHAVDVRLRNMSSEAGVDVSIQNSMLRSGSATFNGVNISLESLSKATHVGELTLTDSTVEGFAVSTPVNSTMKATIDQASARNNRIQNGAPIPVARGITYTLNRATVGDLRIEDNINLRNVVVSATNSPLQSVSISDNQRFDVSGFTVNDAIRDAIQINATSTAVGTERSDVRNLRISGNTITGNLANTVTVNGIVLNLTDSNLGDYGAANAGATITGNTIQNLSGTAASPATAISVTASASNNFVTENGGLPLRLDFDGDGTANDINGIAANQITSNNGRGIVVRTQKNTNFLADVTKNTIDGGTAANRSSAVLMTFADKPALATADSFALNFSENTISNSQGTAVGVSLQNDAVGGLTISGNEITNTAVAPAGATGSVFTPANAVAVILEGIAGSQEATNLLKASTIDNNFIGITRSTAANPNQPRPNAANGIFINTQEQSVVRDLRIESNTLRNNGTNNNHAGLVFQREDQSSLTSSDPETRAVIIAGNTIGTNRNGILLDARNGSVDLLDFSITGNFVGVDAAGANIGNLDDGINLRSQADARLLADISNNQIRFNTRSGINLNDRFDNFGTDKRQIGGVWTENTISNNLENGILITGRHGLVDEVTGVSTPLVIGQFGFGNVIENNTLVGIQIFGPITVVTPQGALVRSTAEGETSIIDNIVRNNGRTGILAISANEKIDIRDNQIEANQGKGIDLQVLHGVPALPTNNGRPGLFNATIRDNVITGQISRTGANAEDGDGIEVSGFELVRATGVPLSPNAPPPEENSALNLLNALLLNNFVDSNQGRGIDIVNVGAGTMQLKIGDGSDAGRNTVVGNELDGIRVINTGERNQPEDGVPTAARPLGTTHDVVGGTAAIDALFSPDIMLDVSRNTIRDNGISLPDSIQNGGVSEVNGAGLVILAGAVGQGANPINTGFDDFINEVGANSGDPTAGNGRINLRVIGNAFEGNFGNDLVIAPYIAVVPPQTNGVWDTISYSFTMWLDPLVRINAVVTDNTGNGMDVIRAAPDYTNNEDVFKSRLLPPARAPGGPFGSGVRPRNATRLAVDGDPAAGNGFSFVYPGVDERAYGVQTGNASLQLNSRFIGVGPNPQNINTPITTLRVEAGFDQSGTTSGFPFYSPSAPGPGSEDNFDDTSKAINNGSLRIENGRIDVLWDTVSQSTFSYPNVDSPTYLRASVSNFPVLGNASPGVVTINFSDFVRLVDIRDFRLLREGLVITGASNTPLLTITSAGHGLVDGDRVLITGVKGNLAANGQFTVANATGNTFQIRNALGNFIAGNGNYTGGGSWDEVILLDVPGNELTVSPVQIPVTTEDPNNPGAFKSFTIDLTAVTSQPANYQFQVLAADNSGGFVSGFTAIRDVRDQFNNQGNLLTRIIDGDGVLQAYGLNHRFTVDTSRPVASILDITPDPRNSAAGIVSVTFSEPVTGVDIADFELYRTTPGPDGMLGSGDEVVLPVNLGAVTVTPDPDTLTVVGTTEYYTRFTLNLNRLSGAPGTYELRLISTDLNTVIQDTAQNLMAEPVASTLQSAVNFNEIQITLTDVTGFPPFASAANPFVVELEGEQMLVTGITGTTLIVTRGFNGTTPAGHAASVVVTLKISETDLWTVDTSLPFVTSISDSLVTTSVRSPINAQPSSVIIIFSEDVTGVDVGDLSLTRTNAGGTITNVDLSGFVLFALSGNQYELNLSGLSATAGTYFLTVNPLNSQIFDLAQNAFLTSFTVNSGNGWVLDTTAPTADLIDVSPNPRQTPVDALSTIFSEPVNGVNVADVSTQYVLAFEDGTSDTAGTISNATNSNLIVITSASHGLENGDLITIREVQGNTAANGVFEVRNVTATTFELFTPDGSVTPVSGNGVYTSGGRWVKNVPLAGAVSDTSDTPTIEITSPKHGLADFSSVTISGVLGNTAANGAFEVRNVTQDTFELFAADGSGTPVSGNGAYAGGGRWIRNAPVNGSVANVSGTGVGPIVITNTGNHGLLTGMAVTVMGVVGNTAANGLFTITRIDDTSFSLGGTVGNGDYVSGGFWQLQGLPFSQQTATRYVLDISSVSLVQGTYIVSLLTDRGITDQAGTDLAAAVGQFNVADQVVWTNGPDEAPTAKISPISTPRGTNAGLITIVFSEPLNQANGNPLDSTDFRLTRSRAITGATGTGVSPIVITSANHGLASGQQVTISGVGGNTAANGTFMITVVDANSFSLTGSTGNGAYVAGTGAWTRTIPVNTAPITKIGPTTYTLDLTDVSLTDIDGNYVLQLLNSQATPASASVLEDDNLNDLANDDDDMTPPGIASEIRWMKDVAFSGPQVAPNGFIDVQRSNPLGSITKLRAVQTLEINFTVPVQGIVQDDASQNFLLTRRSLKTDGTLDTSLPPIPVSLDGVLVQRVTASKYRINLSALTGSDGQYAFTVLANGRIKTADPVPVELKNPQTQTWTKFGTLRPTSLTDAAEIAAQLGNEVAGGGTNYSLRQAIQEANSLPGDDIIELATGTYVLNIFGVQEDLAATGDLDIRDNLIIRGKGTGTTTIQLVNLATGVSPSTTNRDRLFQILAGVNVTIQGVTMQDGMVLGSQDGGAILNSGTLTVLDSSILGNKSQDDAGAINNTGALTILRTTLANNQANATGGAIRNAGTLTIVSSTLSGNTSGISLTGVNGASNAHGGALMNVSGFSATLEGVTISGNTSRTGAGGGIRNDGTLRLINDTIVSNRSLSAGAGISRNLGTVTIGNTIVTDNQQTITGTPQSDVVGTFQSLGGNIVRTPGTATGFTGVQDQLNVNPNLQPLDFNGGPTQTHALLANSLAVDAGISGSRSVDQFDLDGDSDFAELTPRDQRGGLRDLDGPAAASRVDVGAFEFGNFFVDTTDDSKDVNQGDGLAEDGLQQTSLRAAIMESNLLAGENAIFLAGEVYALKRLRPDDVATPIVASITQAADMAIGTVPLNGSIGTVKITFSERVAGFNIAHLSLMRTSGGLTTNIPLANPNFTLNPVNIAGTQTPDMKKFTIDLTNATTGSVDAVYVLTVNPTATVVINSVPTLVNIRNIENDVLAAPASVTWVRGTDRFAPSVLSLTPVVPQTLQPLTNVSSVNITFNERVVGATVSNFRLLRNGTEVIPVTVTTTVVDPLDPTTNPANFNNRTLLTVTPMLTAAQRYGNFTLTFDPVVGANTTVKDTPGQNNLVGTSTVSWVNAPDVQFAPIVTPRIDEVTSVTLRFTEPVAGLSDPNMTNRPRQGLFNLMYDDGSGTGPRVVDLSNATLTPQIPTTAVPGFGQASQQWVLTFVADKAMFPNQQAACDGQYVLTFNGLANGNRLVTTATTAMMVVPFSDATPTATIAFQIGEDNADIGDLDIIVRAGRVQIFGQGKDDSKTVLGNAQRRTTITGKDPITGVSSNDRLFDLTVGSNVAFSGVELVNGRVLYERSGGAIRNLGALTINDSDIGATQNGNDNNPANDVLEGNFADGNGGAIFNAAPSGQQLAVTNTLTFVAATANLQAAILDTDTTLTLNTVVGFPTTGQFVIQVGTEQMLVTAVNVATNRFTVTRGFNGTVAAPQAANAVVTQVSISTANSTLTLNSVANFPTNAPFVILVDSEQMQVTAVNAAANQFTVSRGFNGTSPVPHFLNATVTLLSSTTINRSGVANNMAGSRDSGATFGKGGAIYNENGALSINEGIYISNSATTDGGVVFNGNSATMSVLSATFLTNSAGRDGGVIYNNDTAVATISASTLTGNRADVTVNNVLVDFDGDGGAIYNENSATLTLETSLLQNNSARNGGALYNDDGSFELRQDKFGVNSAFENGGAIFNSAGGVITLTEGLFTTNRASDDGGAIQNFGRLEILANTGAGTTFESNEAGSDFRPGDTNRGRGGAIFNQDGVVLINTASFSLNRSRGDAGVIFNSGNGSVTTDLQTRGTLTITRGRFDRNRADEDGGVIVNEAFGRLTIDESTFSNNLAGQDGGAIANLSQFTDGSIQSLTIDDTTFNSPATLSLTLDDSTINNNTAARGGAIFNGVKTSSGAIDAGLLAGMTMRNSTLSSNTATASGGGLANFGSARLLNDTIYLNDAPSGAGIASNVGATAPLAQVGLKNTIVAGGVNAADVAGFDANFFDGGHNLIEDVGTITAFDDPARQNILGQNPQLAELRDNGGPTFTHQLLFGSPARDAGDNFATTSGDQRGFNRIFDGDGNGVATIDIGAFESGFVVNSFEDTVDENPGDGINADANGRSTLRAAIMEANARPGEDTIILGSGIFTLELTGRGEDFRRNSAGNIVSTSETGDLDILDDLNIIGTGTELTFIDADTIDRIFQVFGVNPLHPNGGVTLNLSNLTLRNGNATSTDFGGAIFNQGTTTLRNVLVVNNTAGRGGGVYNDSTGTVEIQQSLFRGNLAVQQGGAIYNDGNLSLNQSEIGAASRLAAIIPLPPASTLATAISASATTITVASASTFTTAAPFVIKVDSEQMQVTAVSGNTFTVTRGFNNSAVAAHAANAAVTSQTSTITLSDVRNFPTGDPSRNDDDFIIQVDAERMRVTGTAGKQFTVERAFNGTVASTHLASAFATLGNIANIHGGGLFNLGTVEEIDEVSFSGNLAQSRGGGLYNAALTTQLTSVIGNLLNPVGAAANTITLVNAANFPTAAGFTIQIDNEQLQVTGVAGNVFTVARGVNGTTAAAHAANAPVTLLVTATSTVIVVNNAAVFPTTLPFRIQVDNEQMQVTNVDLATNSLTVTRGFFGTTPASHLPGATVTVIGENEVNIRRTTFLDNFASSRGAAIFNEDVLNIVNSTITNNDAGANAGLANAVSGQVTINLSTIVDNVAFRGGGLANSLIGTVDIRNTIVADNVSTTITGVKAPNVRGRFDTQGNNFIGNNADSLGFAPGILSDQVGFGTSPIDPVLRAVNDNGGLTQTHAARTGSPIIDAGDNTGGVTEDQRGAPRPANKDSDIGAVEQQDVRVKIASPSQVKEGNFGSTKLTFTLSLVDANDQPTSSIQEIRVNYTLQGDTAFAGEDFVDLPLVPIAESTSNLSASATATTLTVTDENIGLRAPFTIQVEQEQMLVTAIAGTTLTVVRGFNGTVVTSHSGSVAVPLVLSARVGTIVFAPNQLTQTLEVLVNGDTTIEEDEQFLINLSVPGDAAFTPILIQTQAVGQILSDDTGFRIRDVNKIEGESGSQIYEFQVSVVGANLAPFDVVTVDYVIVNGSAQSGSDYAPIDPAIGTVMFTADANGEVTEIRVNGVVTPTARIQVQVNGDDDVEGNENFFVNLTSDMGDLPFEFNKNRGIGTIFNDDLSFSISDAFALEGNPGNSTPMTFVVTLDQRVYVAGIGGTPKLATTTALVSTAGASATADQDFTSINNTVLSFSGTTISRNVTVQVLGDLRYEVMPKGLLTFTPGTALLQSGAFAADTTLMLDSVGAFPAAGDFVIQIDAEQMLVTAVNAGANEFAVTRGFNSTVAADHAASSTVTQLSIASSSTKLTVNSVAGFPSDTPFLVLIDSEVMQVTAVNSGTNELTVTRGFAGMTAAVHSADAAVSIFETFQLQVSGGTIINPVTGLSMDDSSNAAKLSTPGTGTIIDNDPPPDRYRIYIDGVSGNIKVDLIQTSGMTTTTTTLVNTNDHTSALPVAGDFMGATTDDLFLVDFINGNPIPTDGLFIDGENQVGADTLQFDNGTFSTVIYDSTSPGSGVVNLDGSFVTYTGLEPITDNTFADNRIFNSPVVRTTTLAANVSLTATSITVANASQLMAIGVFVIQVDNEQMLVTAVTGNTLTVMRAQNGTTAATHSTGAVVGSTDSIRVTASAGTVSINGPTFESVTARAPVTSLTINGNTGNNSIVVGSSGPSFTALLTVNGGNGNDNINLAAWAFVSSVFGGNGNDTLTGGSDADFLDGGDGNDVINGGSGNDQIFGGLGDDNLQGGLHDDLIDGGDDNDVIQGNDGVDALFGGNGNDTVDGGAGNETVDGGFGNDIVTGGAGDDVVLGNDGNDTLSGGTGADSVDGGFGDDLMYGNDSISGDGSTDTINGQDGSDIISYIDISAANNTFTLTSTQLMVGAETEIIVDADRAFLVAGSGNNLMIATSFTGSVTMNGGGGLDTLLGGSGSDSLIGGTGDDSLVGNDGNDTINGGDGNDCITGGLGDDVMTGDVGIDTISGGDGNDNASGGDGNDSITGGIGIDTLDGGNNNDTLFGNDDGDSLLGGGGQDSIDGGNGADSIDGGDGDDTAFGQAGNDDVRGGAGNDTLQGNDGDDSVNGMDGNDTLDGNIGFDTLFGGAGDDLLISSDGNDQVLGQGGSGDIFTFNGDNTIADIFTITAVVDPNPGTGRVGIGLARLNPGLSFTTVLLGVEVFTLNLNGGNDLVTLGDLSSVNDLTVLNINAGDGNDTIDGSLSLSTTVALRMFLGAGNDSVLGGAGNDTIQGEAGNDTIIANDGNDSLVGGDGNDSLNGNGGNDTINGGLGDDSIWGGAGTDLLSGSDGKDTILGQGSSDTIDGGIGDDFLDGGYGDSVTAGSGNDSIRGGAGNDKIAGRDGVDTLFGEDGNDTIKGGDGNDNIDGGDGNDLISGDQGNDTLNGMAGNDFLLGGVDNDRILGGAGNDTCVGEAGNDYVDGQGGTDKVLGGNGTGTNTKAPGDTVLGAASEINELFKILTARPSIFSELNF